MAETPKTGHAQIAEEIIKAMKEGTAPYLKSWNPGDSYPPINPASGTAYSGINRMTLSLEGYADPRWMTLNQANKQEYRIKKGSKSKKIEYWMWETKVPRKDENGLEISGENGKPEMETVKLTRPTVRYFSVFHASQLQTKDGNDLPAHNPKPIQWNPDDKAETILINSGATILHDQRDKACYRINKDEIHLPPKENFPTSGLYYGTALHELGHWTRHPSRLDRENGPFGSPVYAKEELRAEIASLMICQELGLPFDPGQHVSYVDSWIKALEDDPNEIFKACRDAEKIKEYVMGLELKRDQVERTEPEIAKEMSTEKIYLSVPFKEKEEAKTLGATWDSNKKSWCARPGTDLQKLSKWIAPEQVVEKVTTVDPKPELLREKTFIHVPYAEKDAARTLGAQWDKDAKLWFAPAGADISPLAKWIPEVAPTPTVTMSPEDEFSQALKTSGLKLDGSPVMNGTIQRVAVEGGKQGAKDGAYSAYLDGKPNGWIDNHKTGERTKWVATGQVLTDDQKIAMRAEAAEKLARREAERLADQKIAIGKVRLQFNSSDTDLSKLPNNYLEKKGVCNNELLEQNNGDYISSIRCNDGKIIIPGHDKDGSLKTVQTISEDGEKHFAKGCPKAGAMHIIAPIVDHFRDNPCPDDEYTEAELYESEFTVVNYPSLETIENPKHILIAEGYATGASLHLATGKPVVVAFDSGNLKAVALAVREVHPNAKITICADNDHKLETNVGLDKAKEAAQAVDGNVVVPSFNKKELAAGLTDFNDLHQSRGLKAVREILKKQTQEKEATFVNKIVDKAQQAVGMSR